MLPSLTQVLEEYNWIVLVIQSGIHKMPNFDLIGLIDRVSHIRGCSMSITQEFVTIKLEIEELGQTIFETRSIGFIEANLARNINDMISLIEAHAAKLRHEKCNIPLFD